MQIIPGILETNWIDIEHRIQQAKTFANTLHIDIIDGEFVNHKTFLDPAPFTKYSKEIFFELHMMVIDPIKLVAPFAAAGFRRFLGHVEHMSSQKEFVDEAKKFGEAGLPLDGPTHESVIKVPFETLDTALVYTSDHVGFSVPPLVPERLEKTRHLKRLTNIPIEVDGGISDKTILKEKDAGATRFVSTSFLFHSENPAEQYRQLVSLV